MSRRALYNGFVWVGFSMPMPKPMNVYQDVDGCLWLDVDPATGEEWGEPVIPFDGDVYATVTDALHLRNGRAVST